MTMQISSKRGSECFLDEDSQRGLWPPVPVHERL